MSHWYCNTCKEQKDPRQVTFQANCEDCGTEVKWVDTENWQKKVIKQNFANAIKRLEYTIDKLENVICKDRLDDMKNVVDEYQHLIDLLREVE
jgi:hypothetical protein